MLVSVKYCVLGLNRWFVYLRSDWSKQNLRCAPVAMQAYRKEGVKQPERTGIIWQESLLVMSAHVCKWKWLPLVPLGVSASPHSSNCTFAWTPTQNLTAGINRRAKLSEFG